MAQIVLSEVGAALGGRLLPQGVSVLGQQIAGQAIGRAVGSIAGRQVDQAVFAQDVTGPRIKALHVMESREGAGISNVYGRMRVAGQVIWAARFTETRRESGGGKGGPNVNEYQYSVSFAVGVCEGPATRIDRIWANGEPLDPSSVTMRVYPGTETQEPDPIIEAVEGVGAAPAYRGLCYIVFEDLPLTAYGNRLPQLSFEVVRVPPGSDTLASRVRGVNIIPASGEFAYATDVIRTRQFPGIEIPQNANSGGNRADFSVSLEQLADELPAVSHAALTVAWFGDDLRAGHCTVRPKVEVSEKVTRPWAWEGGGLSRSDVPVVSTDDNGRPNYGGTPADWSVIQAIQAQKSLGIDVTLSPFLLMDVPPGNGRMDPYGAAEQAAFPWRGRITSLSDKTAAARADVDAFLGAAEPGHFILDVQKVRYTGPASDWGYRRFVLHLAWLAKAAGGVDGFLLGSELRGLTRLRDAAGRFPFVEGLIALAQDVRTILGPNTTITYAADWTEYGAYAPGDGSNDVLFPLDAFWADSNVDLVAVDWYPPAGDWRNENDHLDALAGYTAPDDADYLRSQLTGGEAYHWYYASDLDRASQVRTPIVDTAHAEHWVFRQKDIEGWWQHAHHERPGGVRQSQPTAWVPGSKPVRFAEIGFPAVDKGTNAPNLFYDPKSSESAIPPFSTGARDDLLQRRALTVALDHFQGQAFVEKAYVWCWDGRPYPAFPLQDDVWGDGDNWRYGHWLNGRTGMAPLADVVADLAIRGNVGAFNSLGLDGIVEGYTLDGISTMRQAIEPLRSAYSFGMVEDGGGLRAVQEDDGETASLTIGASDIGAAGIEWTDTLLDASPTRLVLTYADVDNSYSPATAEARVAGKDPRTLSTATLPLAFSQPEAERIAADLLTRSQPYRTAAATVPFTRQDIAAGSVIAIEGIDVSWRVTSVADGIERSLTLEPLSGSFAATRAVTPPSRPAHNPITAAPETIVIDGPALPGAGDDARPLIAVAASPWPGEVVVEAGPSLDAMTERARLSAPAILGRLNAALPSGAVGRWDRASKIDVTVSEASLASMSETAVLAGANLVLIENADGWELLAFQSVALVSSRTYQLTTLLRGLQGTMPSAAPSSAYAVFVGPWLERGDLSRDEIGLDLIWRAAGDDASQTIAFENRQKRPWPVAHLRAEGGVLTWQRRSRDNSDSWVLPDVEESVSYTIHWEMADGATADMTVTDAFAPIPPGAVGASVSEMGADGQRGLPQSLTL